MVACQSVAEYKQSDDDWIPRLSHTGHLFVHKHDRDYSILTENNITLSDVLVSHASLRSLLARMMRIHHSNLSDCRLVACLQLYSDIGAAKI